MQLRQILLICFILCANLLSAQIRYGFKTGLNFASIRSSDLEKGPNGADLESFDNVTGFHIGMTFSHYFTDDFGLRGEFGYSKKGYKYTYDGPGYRTLQYTNGSTTVVGNTKYQISNSISYLDLPVVAFYRLGKIEVSGGLYLAGAIQTVGDGLLTVSGARTTPVGATVKDFTQSLFYNYRTDDPGEGKTNGDLLTLALDGKNYDFPTTIGAYYNQTEDRGNLFNGVDYGLTAGLSFFLNSALYLGGRIQYGLGDVTRNKADVTKQSLTDGQPTYRNDKDRNFVIQAAVGFTF